MLHADSAEADPGALGQCHGSRDNVAKQKPWKLLPPDILLQDDCKDSSVDRTKLGGWV